METESVGDCVVISFWVSQSLIDGERNLDDDLNAVVMQNCVCLSDGLSPDKVEETQNSLCLNNGQNLVLIEEMQNFVCLSESWYPEEMGNSVTSRKSQRTQMCNTVTLNDGGSDDYYDEMCNSVTQSDDECT